MPESLRVRERLLVLVAVLALPHAIAQAAPPDEGECPAVSGLADGARLDEDAAPVLLREGMELGVDDLLALRQLLPDELWRHREVFFHEGMRMEIGPCHRRYPTPLFFREATAKFAGQPRIGKDGNLEKYSAGLPFPPKDIEPEGDEAAARWAWNLEMRFRGAGPRGSFRITDLPSRLGTAHTYRGDFFQLLTRYRSDLPESDYQVPDSGDKVFAAGGHFDHPFNVRHLAWRQFRPKKAMRRSKEADDTFVYVPTMRKPRRAASTWLDGLFFPRYSTGGDTGGGGVTFGEGGGGINPTAGLSIAQSEHNRRGMVGLALRPNAYVWRLRGERDVLAPLNGSRVGYPKNPDRNFGHSGLSVASDRWEVRRAIVIEGALKIQPGEYKTLTVYVDYQTQQPLYWITRGSKRRLLEVGILVHRFSGDVAGYPTWPDSAPADLFDPVAASFFDAADGAGGWIRESYDVRSLPATESERRRMTSVDPLSRGR